MSSLLKLVAFLSKSSTDRRFPGVSVGLLIAASILAGLSSTALLATINSSLGASDVRAYAPWFFGLCALLPASRFLSELLLVRLSQGITYELRMRFVHRILGAPLRHLEEVGASRLLAVLAEDVQRFTGTVANLPVIVLQISVVLSCLGFMCWLSWQLFLLVLAVVVFGLVTFQLPTRWAMRYIQRARDSWDDLLESFRGLTEGTKELKVHQLRREAFVKRLVSPTAESLREDNIRGGTIYAIANCWGQVLFFVLIGVLLFIVPDYWTAEATIFRGYVLAILYMLTPLDVIMNAVPNMARAVVSMEQVEKMGLSLVSAIREENPKSLPAATMSAWKEIRLSSLTHTYYREAEDDVFSLGPIDLSIKPGELIFVIGGNGSGKTTLAKLLIGLYEPEGGSISIDNEPVTDQTRDAYRQLFSVVFSDFYLFDMLLGLEHDKLDHNARRYLVELHLQHKVKVEDGTLSTVQLSQGQRKRLALLTAYLEDRQVYLFDEWAADQDPYFKEIFYCQLVPDLRRRGKTVILISHDDHYYGSAERIVRLDSGQIEFDGPPDEYLLKYSRGSFIQGGESAGSESSTRSSA